jgi:serine/threonine protein kinase/Tfp pilus assembly protein PilF
MPPISPERWRALSPYLDEALEIPPDRRAAWVTAISTRDAELGADLRTLLAEQEAVQQERFLDNAVLDARTTVAPALAGQVLGAYRLISPVGQGGSGSVWLAERCDGRFQGRAAVKVLNLALIARAGEERFKREGTILARLRHPSIAQLIDAGVSPAGLPYLVLEFVDGQTIDHYCDERALGIEARIRLFLDVLDAVAYAHASLTVHRDIKPANVLVSTDGQVKLLDFGIARLLEPTDEWGAMVAVKSGPITREVGRALTPEFAAPEQLSGGAVTTATDVYALGVLLYLLLTGQHPAGRAVDSPITLVRAIVETEPPRVSDAVVSRTETEMARAEHAARCGTTTSRLRRTLRGDLDTIVAKALKKNTAERYASVAALADDLRRYLRDEPISARPDTLRYRTKTFVRRHRGMVGMAGAVVLLAAAMTSVYTIRLSAERDRAQREAAKAIKVSELLMGLLTRADPFAARTTAEPTLRHLLDSGAEQVQTELADQPGLQSEMLTMIGRTYRRLGVYDRAQPLLEQALASGQQAFGAEHVRIADTLHDLGVVLGDRGEFAAAGRHLEQALAMRRKLLGEHPHVAVTLAELGRMYQDQGMNGRAEPLQREALEIRRKLLGEKDPETAVSLSDLGSVLRLNGDLSGAESLLRQCLEINRAARGEEHPNTTTTMHDLALITASRGDQRAAEWQLRYVLALQRKTLGETHPIVATSLNNLARVLVASRRYDEAATLLQEALDIVRPRLGSRHQLVAIYTINAGAVQLARRQPAIAEALLREGLRIRLQAAGVLPGRRRTLPDDDWSTGATKSLLGAALVAQARYVEAEGTLLEARAELEAMAPVRDQDVKTTIGRLVELYRAWGKPDKAAAYRALLSP